jgi:plastocyanin
MLRRTFVVLFSILAALTLAMCAKSTAPRLAPAPAPGGGGADPAFDLRFPAANASASYTFTKAGTWSYQCTPHASVGMTGTVIVSAGAGADSDTVAVGRNAAYASAPAFKPSTVTIKVGGTVRWINRSTMTIHTVTRP